MKTILLALLGIACAGAPLSARDLVLGDGTTVLGLATGGTNDWAPFTIRGVSLPGNADGPRVRAVGPLLAPLVLVDGNNVLTNHATAQPAWPAWPPGFTVAASNTGLTTAWTIRTLGDGAWALEFEGAGTGDHRIQAGLVLRGSTPRIEDGIVAWTDGGACFALGAAAGQRDAEPGKIHLHDNAVFANAPPGIVGYTFGELRVKDGRPVRRTLVLAVAATPAAARARCRVRLADPLAAGRAFWEQRLGQTPGFHGPLAERARHALAVLSGRLVDGVFITNPAAADDGLSPAALLDAAEALLDADREAEVRALLEVLTKLPRVDGAWTSAYDAAVAGPGRGPALPPAAGARYASLVLRQFLRSGVFAGNLNLVNEFLERIQALQGDDGLVPGDRDHAGDRIAANLACAEGLVAGAQLVEFARRRELRAAIFASYTRMREGIAACYRSNTAAYPHDGEAGLLALARALPGLPQDDFERSTLAVFADTLLGPSVPAGAGALEAALRVAARLAVADPTVLDPERRRAMLAALAAHGADDNPALLGALLRLARADALVSPADPPRLARADAARTLRELGRLKREYTASFEYRALSAELAGTGGAPSDERLCSALQRLEGETRQLAADGLVRRLAGERLARLCAAARARLLAADGIRVAAALHGANLLVGDVSLSVFVSGLPEAAAATLAVELAAPPGLAVERLAAADGARFRVTCTDHVLADGAFQLVATVSFRHRGIDFRCRVTRAAPVRLPVGVTLRADGSLLVENRLDETLVLRVVAPDGVSLPGLPARLGAAARVAVRPAFRADLAPDRYPLTISVRRHGKTYGCTVDLVHRRD